jgi:hypothetical protein
MRAGVKASPIEEQYFLAEYNVLHSTIEDYAGKIFVFIDWMCID